MSLKKFFVLFSPKNKITPTLYKTKLTVNKYIEKDPELQFKTFPDETSAQQYIKQLSAEVQTSARQSNQENKKKIETPTSIHKLDTPKTEYEQIKELDKIYQDKIQNIRKQWIFKKFLPAPLLRQGVPSKLNLYFDGSSRMNPGLSAIGYVGRSDDNKLYFKRAWGIGHHTNNQAEFYALSWGLLDCVLKGALEVKVMGDSQLIINIMNGTYNPRKDKLYELKNVTKQVQSLLLKVTYEHIDRSLNKQADALAREASQYSVRRFGR